MIYIIEKNVNDMLDCTAITSTTSKELAPPMKAAYEQ